jgi:hypothetical protein
VHSSPAGEERLEVFPSPLQFLLGEHDRSSPIGRIAAWALLAEPISHILGEALLGPVVIMLRQPHQGENPLVNLVVIDLHADVSPCCNQEFGCYCWEPSKP